jgi:hypothetical protein
LGLLTGAKSAGGPLTPYADQKTTPRSKISPHSTTGWPSCAAQQAGLALQKLRDLNGTFCIHVIKNLFISNKLAEIHLNDRK